jgi:hypothetical protein
VETKLHAFPEEVSQTGFTQKEKKCKINELATNGGGGGGGGGGSSSSSSSSSSNIIIIHV